MANEKSGLKRLAVFRARLHLAEAAVLMRDAPREFEPPSFSLLTSLALTEPRH